MVEDHDVGPSGNDHGDGTRTVVRLADDLDLGFPTEQGTQRLTWRSVVVDPRSVPTRIAADGG